MNKLKKWLEDSDRVYELHKRILARQGYALYELEGCPEPNYECVKKW